MSECPNDQPVCKYEPADCDCGHPEPSVQRRTVVDTRRNRLASDAAHREAALQAAERLRAQPRQRTHAILADSLKCILAHIDRSALQGKRDAALLLLGFVGGFRASEMTRLAAGQFREKLISPVSVSVPDSEVNKFGRVILIRHGRSSDTDPILALHEWLTATGIRGEEALFQRISPRGAAISGDALSVLDVGRIIRRRADDAGFGDRNLTAHSLRYGHQITRQAEGDVDL